MSMCLFDSKKQKVKKKKKKKKKKKPKLFGKYKTFNHIKTGLETILLRLHMNN